MKGQTKIIRHARARRALSRLRRHAAIRGLSESAQSIVEAEVRAVRSKRERA